MSGRILRPHAGQKPPLGGRLDPSSGFAVGLQGLWLFNEGADAPHDSVSALAATICDASAPAWGTDQSGTVCVFNGVGWRARSGPIVSGRTAYTMAALITTTADAIMGGRAIYAERAPSGNDIVKMDYVNAGLTGSANRLVLTVRDDGGALTQLVGTRVINDGKPHLVVMTVSGSNGSIYTDGTLDVSTSSVPTGAFTNALEARIGSDSGDGSSRWIGNVGLVAVWSRALSPAEVQQLYVDPYALLQAPRQVWGIATTGGGAADPFPLVYPVTTGMLNNAVYRM